MTSHDLIERYVQDVARRLPQAMRADVAAELRALIADDVAERAAGRTPDAQVTTEALLALGPPAELALGYSAPPPIIEPVDVRLFGKLAFGVLTALALLAVSVILSMSRTSRAEWREIAGQVADDTVNAAFILLGVLLSAFWIAGAVRRRRATPWSPQKLPPARDPDHIHRTGHALAITAWTLGLVVLVDPLGAFDVVFGGQAPAALRQAFTYDGDFLSVRAPMLWSVLTASLVIQAWATIEGRWRRRTRQAEFVVSLALGLACGWSLLSGDVFQAEPTDQPMKFALALTAGFTVIGVWRHLRDRRAAGRPA